MIGDRNLSISLTCAVAWVSWLAATLLMVGAVVSGDTAMGQAGLFVGMIGATATVRAYFISLGRRIKAALVVAATESASVHTLSRLN